MTTTAMLVRRFLADYTRNGPNLVLLAVIPVVFVVVAAPALADAARLLGGTGGGPALETVTSGWAAAFLTGVAAFESGDAARAKNALRDAMKFDDTRTNARAWLAHIEQIEAEARASAELAASLEASKGEDDGS